MPYQALFYRSLPEPKVIFFHWQGIETKINLVAPRRQTVLRNTPTGPATPCARPRDLQIANKGSYDSSDWMSRFLRKKGRFCPDTSKGASQLCRQIAKMVVKFDKFDAKVAKFVAKIRISGKRLYSFVTIWNMSLHSAWQHAVGCELTGRVVFCPVSLTLDELISCVD
ncbi:hypothetical protein AVEN_117554-1 [Araneus ventricosus]|uniref:Uncharacterized protein n=1 Tax=Araneus ventricosus TaxID=182803 RepID=A0A4Y2PYQ2_ARAVE|nr:hypothetical protein AVEN_117554-1 [Araneus ventricosus]